MIDLSDIYEALESVRKWKPVYKALLRHMPKDQAIEALKYLIKIEREKLE